MSKIHLCHRLEKGWKEVRKKDDCPGSYSLIPGDVNYGDCCSIYLQLLPLLNKRRFSHDLIKAIRILPEN